MKTGSLLLLLLFAACGARSIRAEFDPSELQPYLEEGTGAVFGIEVPPSGRTGP